MHLSEKCLFALILFLPPITASSQVLNGRILDRQTEEPVPYASIYINNSFRGTSSDIKGVFKLDISQLSGQEIIVSCLGYKSEILGKVEPGKSYVIYLQQQSILLNDITVVAEPDDTPRKKKIEMFLNDFLGQTNHSKKCVIINLDDVRLSYSQSSQTLVATSPIPLIIQNKSLGYTITYFLEEFKKTESRVFYRGYSIFKEDSTLSKNELNRANRNRKRAYLGSRMHFFRMLWSNRLQDSSFDVIDTELRVRPTLTCTIEDNDGTLKSFAYSNTLKVIYKEFRASYITFRENGKIIFNKNGYFDPSGHSWQGYMAIQRIGDLLPFEYWPEGQHK